MPRRTNTGALVAPVGGVCVGVVAFVVGREARADGRSAAGSDVAAAARTLRQIHSVDADGLDLPILPIPDPRLDLVRSCLDHSWIDGRRPEVEAFIRRAEELAARRAWHAAERLVLCHTDYGGTNLLMHQRGGVAAVLDWDHAVLAPPELDLWIIGESVQDAPTFLAAYGDEAIAADGIEYAWIVRGLMDMTARLSLGVDRAGVEKWGFERLQRTEAVRDLVSAPQ